MKKVLLFAMTLSFALPVLAGLEGDGYYRVQNSYTKRWAYLRDNRGSYDKGSTSADVAALELVSGIDGAISDPASVFYLSKAPTGEYRYDIAGQGTSIYSFFNNYLDIKPVRNQYDGKDCYHIYATDSGVVRYLGDVWKDFNSLYGMASVDAVGDDRRWYIEPIDAETDQYFGIIPSVTCDRNYYYPFYASFPFSANSKGLKFYKITEIDARGAVIYKEIEGVVPAATPVIVECESQYVWNNKFNLGGTPEAEAASGNCLKGVYFDNQLPAHYNRVAFNRQTMRVLGSYNGRPAFVESDIEFLPPNQAYLQLNDSSQYNTQVFFLMTEEEYKDYVASLEPDPGPGDNPGNNDDNKDPGNNDDNKDPGNNDDNKNPGNNDDNKDPGNNDDNKDPGNNDDNKDPGNNDDNKDPEMGVATIPMSAIVDVYSLDGRRLKSGISKEEAITLGKGLYILRNGSLTEKVIVR